MDTTQRWPGDADDNFDALDFGDEPGGYSSGAALDFGDEPSHDGGAALDFGDEPSHDGGEQSVIEALGNDEPGEYGETGTGPRAIDTLPEDIDAADDESASQLTTVTNPPETVSVTASLDGTVHNVVLSPDAARMTESELADEILVIADLARQQATSNLLTVVLEGAVEAMRELNEVEDDERKGQELDVEEAIADRLENSLVPLSSPKKAAKAQAEVFATRYTSDDDLSPGR